MEFFEADFDFFFFSSPGYRPIFSRAYYCAYGQHHHHHHHHHYPYSPLPPFPAYSPYSPYSPLPPTRVTPPVIPPLPLARPQSADQDYWTGSPRARTILKPAAALRPNNQSKPKKVKPKREKELYVAPVRPSLPAPPHNVWFYSTPPPTSPPTSPPWAPAPYAWTTTISTPGSGYSMHIELKPE
ncbi:hypothetical protein C8J55DRAFT_561542 [Lentinula edodes]|uniref:Uncharacterized protein n=1 Tax=Lentinula lateritia TaxID=40482 RepID=A0A9W9A9I1_9AGAR|nr:hypothetical protein C8J55DRAFT_561542 [Lentinula edodes]